MAMTTVALSDDPRYGAANTRNGNPRLVGSGLARAVDTASRLDDEAAVDGKSGTRSVDAV
jgi:hypothetical protein